MRRAQSLVAGLDVDGEPLGPEALLAFAGSALARDQWRGVLAVVIVYLALWRKYRLEERWMEQTFGEAYRRFREETPALIPNPFRRGARP